MRAPACARPFELDACAQTRQTTEPPLLPPFSLPSYPPSLPPPTLHQPSLTPCPLATATQKEDHRPTVSPTHRRSKEDDRPTILPAHHRSEGDHRPIISPMHHRASAVATAIRWGAPPPSPWIRTSLVHGCLWFESIMYAWWCTDAYCLNQL
jgi:hypothetical protein